MNEVVLTNIRFDRSILKFECELGEVLLEEIEEFYLIEQKTNIKVKARIDTVEGTIVRLYIPTLAAIDEYPMTSGKWFLYVRYKDGGKKALVVSDTVYKKVNLEQNYADGVDAIFDKNSSNYFHGTSKIMMPQRAYYLLVDYQVAISKTNLLSIIKKQIRIFYSYLRNRAFSVLFIILNKLIRKNGKRVLFTSSSRSEIGGNELFIYNKMIERGMDKQYDIAFDYKASIKDYRGFRQKFHFVKHLAISDYIFMDDYQPEIYLNEYDKDVKVIQLWHACGAFKTLGFERLDKKGAPKFNTKVHKCYTHVPVSSQHSVRHHAEAFAIDESKFYPIGVARTDIFFDEEYKRHTTKSILEEYPQLETAQKVILFAPTFRGENAKNAYFPMQMIDYPKMGECLKEINGIMIIKMHPFVTEQLSIPAEYQDYFIDASQYREINDLLFVTDLLITDYSSVIYEMSLLRKPMIFYSFDVETYEKERGFYEPYKEIVPGKIVFTIDELIEEIKKDEYDYPLLDRFIKKNFKYTDGKSTDRVVDLVFNDMLPE